MDSKALNWYWKSHPGEYARWQQAKRAMEAVASMSDKNMSTDDYRDALMLFNKLNKQAQANAAEWIKKNPIPKDGAGGGGTGNGNLPPDVQAKFRQRGLKDDQSLGPQQKERMARMEPEVRNIVYQPPRNPRDRERIVRPTPGYATIPEDPSRRMAPHGPPVTVPTPYLPPPKIAFPTAPMAAPAAPAAPRNSFAPASTASLPAIQQPQPGATMPSNGFASTSSTQPKEVQYLSRGGKVLSCKGTPNKWGRK